MTAGLDDRPMLALAKVTKTYRIGGQTVRALDDITLTLTGGEFVSVVGPSGAGKSTLLHLLGALDRPDSGSIRFEGDEISDLNDEQQSEFRRTQSRIRLSVLQPAADHDGMGERRGTEGARRYTDGEGQVPRDGAARTGGPR